MEDFIENVIKFMDACGQNMTATSNGNWDEFAARLGLSDLYRKLIIEEAGELLKEFATGYSPKDELKEICDLIWVLIGYSHIQSYDLVGAFKEVARSNMSKIDSETGMVLKNSEGKVVKPPAYSPADMSDFIVITSNVQ